MNVDKAMQDTEIAEHQIAAQLVAEIGEHEGLTGIQSVAQRGYRGDLLEDDGSPLGDEVDHALICALAQELCRRKLDVG